MRTPDMILRAQGFPTMIDVRGRNSIADLLPPSKRRPGLYALEFANGSYYIGQALDPVRRFAQHRTNVGGIVRYAFQPCRSVHLNAAEKRSIRYAERCELPLTNRVHVSRVTGISDLDSVVSPLMQTRWTPGAPFREPKPVVLPPDSALRIRSCQRMERLERDVHYPAVLACLREFATCTPFPRSTQLSFWSLSCLPATGAGEYRRYAALSAAMMEVLVLGWFRSEPTSTWGFVNVSRSICMQRYRTLGALRKHLPYIRVSSERAYRDAGQDQLRLQASSIEELTLLLQRRTIARAAGDLLLRLMRARPTIYSQYHCPDLADAVLARTSKMQVRVARV